MNSDLLMVIGLALFPALGNFGGGLLAEWLRPSKTLLNYALHMASGLIIAVVAVEVIPEALAAAPAWLLGLAFLAGGGAYLLIERWVKRWASEESGVGSNAWMVYAAVATDLMGDGLLIGVGAIVSSQMALLLALGQVLADIPEGFAAVANFRNKGMPRSQRLLLSASFALPVVGAAVFAYFTLRGQSESFQVAGLAFVAGIFLLAAIEDMLSEAHESSGDTQWSAIHFLAGFVLFLVVSGSFE